MAKQVTLPTYSANAALIKGAGEVYRSQNKTLPGLDLGLENLQKIAEARKAESEKIAKEKQATIDREETKMANYLANMSYMDTGIVPEQYLPQVQKALGDYKNEYFEVSQQLSQLKSTDPEYQNLNVRLLEINNGIKSIATTFTDKKKNQEDDILMWEGKKTGKRVSATNNAATITGTGAIVRNEAAMKIENGKVLWDLNGNWVRYEDIPEFRVAADDTMTQFNETLGTLSENTKKEGITKERRGSIQNALGQSLENRDVLISMAADQFGGITQQISVKPKDNPQGEAIQITIENIEELIDNENYDVKGAVLNHYMGLVDQAASTGQQRAQKAYNQKLDDDMRQDGRDPFKTNSSKMLGGLINSTPEQLSPVPVAEGFRVRGSSGGKTKGTATWNNDQVVLILDGNHPAALQNSNDVQDIKYDSATGKTTIIYSKETYNRLYGGGLNF